MRDKKIDKQIFILKRGKSDGRCNQECQGDVKEGNLEATSCLSRIHPLLSHWRDLRTVGYRTQLQNYILQFFF